jgi:signal peptidase II
MAGSFLRRPLALGLAVAALVVALDQVSKWWIVEVVMQPPRVIELLPVFNLVMGWNRGVSFGLFNADYGINAWLFTAVAAVVVAFLLAWLRKVEKRLLATAIGLVVGGAVGNVIDRLRFGAVADFIQLHAGGYAFPAFNVADSSITVGAVILVVDSLFERPEPSNNNASRKDHGP